MVLGSVGCLGAALCSQCQAGAVAATRRRHPVECLARHGRDFDPGLEPQGGGETGA